MRFECRYADRRADSDNLQQVMRGRTTILISHRVSTVRNADRIFVLEYGRVAEEGSHAGVVSDAAGITPTCIRSNCSRKNWKLFSCVKS